MVGPMSGHLTDTVGGRLVHSAAKVAPLCDRATLIEQAESPCSMPWTVPDPREQPDRPVSTAKAPARDHTGFDLAMVLDPPARDAWVRPDPQARGAWNHAAARTAGQTADGARATIVIAAADRSAGSAEPANEGNLT